MYQRENVRGATTLLHITNLEHRWTPESRPLRLESLHLGPGDCTQLLGPSGSGKSTMLLAAGTLLDRGATTGDIAAPPCGPGGAAAVFQNPETQILSSQVLDEVMLALVHHGREATRAREAGGRALERVGLGRLAGESTDALSMGQKQRLALAAALALEPRLLLLDEPFSQLDAAGRDMLLDVIRDHRAGGGAALITAHHPIEELADASSLFMGRDNPAGSAPVYRLHLPRPDSEGPPAAELRAVRFGHTEGRPQLDGFDLSIARGECVAVCGENGTGKSTLAGLLTGMLKPWSGSVRTAGVESPGPRRLAGLAALVPQDPDLCITEASVLEEVAFSPWRLGLDDPEGKARTLLRELGIEDLADAPPLALSFGQKRLVTAAAALAGAPQLLILDEPLTGLDRDRAARLLGCVATAVRTTSLAVLMLTHETGSSAGPSRAMAHRTLRLQGGTLT